MKSSEEMEGQDYKPIIKNGKIDSSNSSVQSIHHQNTQHFLSENKRNSNASPKSRREFDEILRQIQIPELEGEAFPRATRHEPIPSYGVILVYDDGDCFEYFCTQCRTTIEFGELVKCGPRKEHLFEYLSLMTDHERQLLLDYGHKRLWKAILLDEVAIFERVRQRSKIVYNTFAPYFGKLLDLTASNVHEPPWIFPKGRHSVNDKTFLQTAVRELEEEANIKLTKYELLCPKPFVENFRGTDGITYSTSYYVLKASVRYEPPPIHVNNVLGETCLSQDMRDYCWISVPKRSGGGEMLNSPLKDRLQGLLVKVHEYLTHANTATAWP